MSLQVEKLEKNMAKLTIEASAEEFENAVQKAYLKNKSRINLPGFRKGKAPRAMIEKMYGKGVFYEDAANTLIPEAYSKALAECELDIVSQPEISVTQIEAGKPFIFTAEVALKPEVTLGEYKGVAVPKKEVTVTDEEVQACLLYTSEVVLTAYMDTGNQLREPFGGRPVSVGNVQNLQGLLDKTVPTS